MPIKQCVILSLALSTSNAFAYKVIGIEDGDGITLLVDQKPLQIRLANIDAPEKQQAYGQRSKQSLSDVCWGKDATYQAQTIDKYGRTVAVVTCDGIEANRAQVERGLAWVYERYNLDRSLPALQGEARTARRGLWADKEPVPPWVFRHPDAAQTKANSDLTCYTGPRGGRYQVVNGKKRYGC
ncbi:MAG TPA: thermonuclease family protein [Noviherbaspirillum sp.]|nr:thermonuclease family protein [Noviherbaspirillum sp.]